MYMSDSILNHSIQTTDIGSDWKHCHINYNSTVVVVAGDDEGYIQIGAINGLERRGYYTIISDISVTINATGTTQSIINFVLFIDDTPQGDAYVLVSTVLDNGKHYDFTASTAHGRAYYGDPMYFTWKSATGYKNNERHVTMNLSMDCYFIKPDEYYYLD